MIFQHTLDAVLGQTKTQTRRVVQNHEYAVRTRYNRIQAVTSHGRVKWRVGKTYAVQPGRGKAQVGRILLERINRQHVTRISRQDALAEGFNSRQEFLRTWQHIHGTESVNVRVWVLTFRLVEQRSVREGSVVPEFDGDSSG